MRIGPPRLHRSDAVAFASILLANLVPLAGIALFGWRTAEVLVLYWIEVCVMLLVYTFVAFFAELPIETDDRTFVLPGTSHESGRTRSPPGRERVGIEVPGPLLSIYLHDFGVISLSFVLGIALWIGPISALEITTVVRDALSPAVLVASVGIVFSHLAELRRDLFVEKRYEELSAHVVLEIPIRIVLFPLFLLLFIAFVGWPWLFFAFVAVPEIFGIALMAARIGFLLVSGVVLMKLTVEWARFRADRNPEPGGVTKWFLPEDPREL
ncbi:MAG: DUF6498-containing protein [Natronomonas sp.]|uniref:DUF6498-containing protein n=1 Tax=Natronomonas sp. TaxID=2184060 RepID=UPI00287009F7|nr:DUF6498-containing protein [Natronomonas sp.]MDR9380171.1 DUF6498-containing protein [Natronomonas sp.]MDR9430759.1 DUF6498-containing protein [Natronomonas sp.]